MTEETWGRVGRALLGRWPSQVAQWGQSGIAAYVEELQADGLTPDSALAALRSFRPEAGKDFPPSVAVVSQLARRDPGEPTFAEMRALIFGPRGVLTARTQDARSSWGPGERDRADEQAMLDRAATMHPLVGSFAARYLRWLRGLNVDDPQFGSVRVRELEQRWSEHVEAAGERGVAALVGSRRGELGRLDPLAAVGVERREITAGSGS